MLKEPHLGYLSDGNTHNVYSKKQKLLSEAFSICLKALYWSTNTSVWVPSFPLFLILSRKIIKFKKVAFFQSISWFLRREPYLNKSGILSRKAMTFKALIWVYQITFCWSFGEKVSITLRVRNSLYWQLALKFLHQFGSGWTTIVVYPFNFYIQQFLIGHLVSGSQLFNFFPYVGVTTLTKFEV